MRRDRPTAGNKRDQGEGNVNTISRERSVVKKFTSEMKKKQKKQKKQKKNKKQKNLIKRMTLTYVIVVLVVTHVHVRETFQNTE